MSNKIGHIEMPKQQQKEDTFGAMLDTAREGKHKAVKGLIENRGMIVSIILALILVFAFTTNINFTSKAEVLKLSLSIFVFMFCSYSMYINNAKSGTRAGKLTKAYIETEEKYIEIKTRIINEDKQVYLGEFCRLYVDEELKNARKDILDFVGIEYEEYVRKWVGADIKDIKKTEKFSDREKQAVIKANALKPVRLTPDMLLKREREIKRRAPLKKTPTEKRNAKYIGRFMRTIITSIFACTIALDVIANPSWSTFSELCIRLLMVVLSGFFGYQTGYENITCDTVDYMHDQIDLLNQFEDFVDAKKQEAKV